MLTAASSHATPVTRPEDPVLGGAFACLEPFRVLAAIQGAGIADGLTEAGGACRMIESLYHPRRYVRAAFVMLPSTELPPDRYWPEGQIVYLQFPVRHPPSRRGTLLHIDGCDFECYRFPNDRRLRGLRTFASRQDAVATWQQWLDPQDRDGPLEADSVRRALIRYVPEQKWIARLRARRTSSRGAVKASLAIRAAAPGVIARLHERHVTLARASEQGDLSFAVPSVVGCDARRGLLGVDWIRGAGFLETLESSDGIDLLQQTVDGLASVHDLRLSNFPAQGRPQWEAELRACAMDLQVAAPELGQLLRTILPRTMRFLDTADELDGRATLHADFHPGQLRVQPERLALFDLERLSTGTPLVDVANFATQLALLGRRQDVRIEATQAARWSAAFLAAWQQARGRVPRSAYRGLAVVSALRLARGALRHLRPGWQDLARVCVEYGDALLEAFPGECVP